MFCYCIFNTRFDDLKKPEQVLFHFEGEPDFDNKTFRSIIRKELGLKYQLCNTDKKIKDHDTDIFFINTEGKNELDLTVGLMDYIYTHRDLGNFIYYGFYNESDIRWVEKINSMGYSNLKAGITKKGEEAVLIKNIINNETSK